jgi:hypothetical protein
MNLIKSINESLKVQEVVEKKEFKLMERKLNFLFPVGQHTELFEDVELFLKQIAGKIKAGENFDAEQSKVFGAKLAALELLADAGTSAAVLSSLGSGITGDASKKLGTIMQQTSGVYHQTNLVDKVLIQVAQRIGKSGVTRNTELLSQLDKVNVKERDAKVREINGMVNAFARYSSKLNQQSERQPGNSFTGAAA